MRYKAILWDLDGTLLDTLCDLTTAVNTALVGRGYPGRTAEEVRAFVGNGARSLIARALPPETDETVVEAVLSDFNTYYATHCREATAPYDGVLPLLTRLQAEGVRSGVVSNKPHYAVVPLAREYFGDRLELAVGSQDGVPRKPAPDTVWQAMNELGVTAEETLYIGDSEVDVQTAQNASVDGLFVTWGFRSKEQLINAGAVHTVDTVDELAQALC